MKRSRGLLPITLGLSLSWVGSAGAAEPGGAAGDATAAGGGPWELTVDPLPQHEWALLPAVEYDSDRGLGLGGVFVDYRYEDGWLPYKRSLTVQLLATTTWLQDHQVRLDWVEVADLPLRLQWVAGFLAVENLNYCGLGTLPDCDTALVPPVAREDDYYLRREVRPYLEGLGRWRLGGAAPRRLANGGAPPRPPVRREVLGGTRLSWAKSGTLTDAGPVPGSLYDRTIGVGDDGLWWSVMTGFSRDTRDEEQMPRRGTWWDGSVRAGMSAREPGRNYGGLNLSGRVYQQADRRGVVVMAGRMIGDLLWGDAPTEELGRMGGLQGAPGIGGSRTGRGLRQQRRMGELKLLEQGELRVRLWQNDSVSEPIAVGVVGFGDFAQTQGRLGDQTRVAWGTGAGLRLAWGHSFVLRVDGAGSPQEDWASAWYVDVEQTF